MTANPPPRLFLRRPVDPSLMRILWGMVIAGGIALVVVCWVVLR